MCIYTCVLTYTIPYEGLWRDLMPFLSEGMYICIHIHDDDDDDDVMMIAHLK
jgi:hypothetical protein